MSARVDRDHFTMEEKSLVSRDARNEMKEY